ncbi:MAG: ABC transporter substrate-binding protein [Deinococcus sp.]|nr:ABC transporter substrate-binding protein [Deinococcus sp.]
MARSRVVVAVLLVGLLAGSLSLAQTRTLVIAQSADASTMDPHNHLERVTGIIHSNIFDTLLFRNARGEIIPWLATAWRQIDDVTTEFDLRRGVTFHNGEPFNAQAVKFTVDRVLDPNYASPQLGQVGQVDHVDIVDDYTVRFVTKAPWPLLLSRLTTNFRIVAPGYYSQNPANVVALNPVGAGPYRLGEWVRDDHVTLVANENYWGGRPPYDQVIFRPVPEPATRLAELLGGGAQIVTDPTPDGLTVIRNTPGVHAEIAPSNRMIFLYLKTDIGGPLANKQVRQALNYAVDVNGIIEFVLEGLGTRIATVVTELDFGHDPTIMPYPYDPDRARTLLADAGYPNGFTFSLVTTGQNEFLNDRQVGEAIVGNLADVGVTVDLHIREFQSYVQQILGHSIPEDAWMVDFGDPIFDADANIGFLFDPAGCCTYFTTPRLTELVQLGRTTVDPARRLEIYSETQRILIDEAPMIFLYHQNNTYGVSDSVVWQGRSDELIWTYTARPQ